MSRIASWSLRPRRTAALGLLAAALGLAGPAGAVTFQVDFAASTYQVQAGDGYADLVAQHQAEVLLSSTTVTALEDVSAPVFAGTSTDYSTWMRTVLDVAAPGTWQFQVGTDWGRGGASVVIDDATGTVLDEFVTTDDVWWGNSWSNPDVFVTTVVLDAGASYTLGWVGFEGCCGGPTTVRFSYEGSPFVELTDANLVPFVTPEPGTALLLGSGLLALALRRRR